MRTGHGVSQGHWKYKHEYVLRFLLGSDEAISFLIAITVLTPVIIAITPNCRAGANISQAL